MRSRSPFACRRHFVTSSVVSVLSGQPWLDAIPFGCWCHYWGVASFQLLEGDLVLFPRPKLSQRVSADGPCVILKLITSNDPPPVNIRVVIGKAAATTRDYRPQPATSPLYEFCELQTLRLRDLDSVQQSCNRKRSGPSFPRRSSCQTASATIL